MSLQSNREEVQSARRTLAVILGLGLLVRVGLLFVFEGQRPEIVDAQDYNELAIRLIETGEYQDRAGHLTSLRPPLYPLGVAGLYQLFGLENFTAVRIAQAFVGLLTTWLVYALGKELYSVRVGLLAAAGYCFYPSLLGFSNLLLSETLFNFFFVAGMFLTVRVIRQPSLPGALGIGLAFALGALTRSILWLFTPLLAVYLLIAISGQLKTRVLVSATMLGTFLLVIAPWAYRNTQVHQTLVIIDVMGGRNVMMGNYEHTPLERSWATITDVTGERAWNRVLAQDAPGYGQLTQGQIDKAAMKYGVRYFFSHFDLSLRRSLVKFFNFWQLERTFVAGMAQGIFGDVPRLVVLGLALVICGSYAAMIFLALFGLLAQPPAQRWQQGALLLGIGFTCLIHSVAFAHSRYHLPLVPILLVYSAAAVIGWKDIWSRKRSWPFLTALAGCVLLSTSWLREFLVVDWHHFQ